MRNRPPAPDEADLLAAETRVAREMNELRDAAGEWLRGRRNALVSLKGLTAAAAAGFTIGSALLRRRAPKQSAAPAVKGSLLTVLAGLAASAIRTRYGDPWTIASRLMAHRGAMHGAEASRAAARYPMR